MKDLRGLLAAVLLSGCGVDTDARPPTYSYVVATVLAPSCGVATCHSSQAATAGLALDRTDSAYDDLQAGGLLGPCALIACVRDEAGLYQVVTTSTGSEPPRMPLDSPLVDADIDLIGRWLEAGAERD